MKEISYNQSIKSKDLEGRGLSLSVKREDLLHPHISGNKFRKLKYNLEEARKKGSTTLLTFGGAYSNHISALSYAGKLNGFKTLGIIRGDELAHDPEKVFTENPTLRFARSNGMEFKFVSRAAYREKENPEFIESLISEFGDFYMVPEGGTNRLAVKGCEEILSKDDASYDYICVSVGTGGTISGLINSAKTCQKVLGFQSLKGDFLEDSIRKNISGGKQWNLIKEYHFGGYAKINEKLISFINDFYQQTTIPLDPVYTGKMMFGIMDLVKKDLFKSNSSILAVHTGGIQGVEGMNQRLLKRNLPLIKI
ncbi:1-aminocyclopropane-1-carboxylate deaminase/D-cysteine desulfhydrase [Lutimonas zeaxanthinifaciens]|uniref:1-aminocyclopropane-1-carboxylate deaminase/D-cysteine desulfhydrase n=1 Tax=Lutimonas zeaxanthinifaciens TaxID=3060215 RepID=UPI00265CD09F|nr:pyridoxal-phosphate dependent enzyme [Lutimonas sp. YSD2104]WKK65262.1 pyridoxal-phosphate dependent enzyme [Lutimonas sp. YSD2104]